MKGRKQHLLVDSLGLLLRVMVTEANTSERVVSAYALMSLLEDYPALLDKAQVVWVDVGYRGDSFALVVDNSSASEVIQRQGNGFEVLPKR